MMVEIVVTTNKDGTLDAKKTMVIVHARRNARMANMVQVLIGVMKMLWQRVLVMQLAAHLVEFQWLVGKVARGDAQIVKNGLCNKNNDACGKETCGNLCKKSCDQCKPYPTKLCDKDKFNDGVCDDLNNNEMCSFDGGDCCDYKPGWNARCKLNVHSSISMCLRIADAR